ncbi:diphthine--ammonia ligase [Muricauda sp. SCSIO 64092]|uniref:Dph6-related ATP pyrophosphatase n=1 Tax=Allomuricauda sp. SCSIO 64092 TaxID=2908842 RepID=UPI001FF61F9A|nr:diphthine--ammonia ligase [Muricauda sp. SCSIO 64092]UOY07001.1 diphthine--ammonia ligase [Muricauda sp. SCSIO 64092]
MDKGKAFFNWSSGKDAAMALHMVQKEGKEVDLLVTTISQKYQRVSMHGLHRSLLEAQAASLGIPLEVIELPENPTMEAYGTTMGERLTLLQNQGYAHSYFGDIFLEDLKVYREQMLHPLGFKAVFPLWKKDTRQLLLDFIDLGMRAIVICVNAQVLDKSFCGRVIDRSFLDDLPSNVDSCGENGEFHTFCFDGPLFQWPIAFTKGEIVYKTYPAPKTEQNTDVSEYGFWYCDLHLKG